MLYAELPGRRVRQGLGDLSTLVWIVVWMRIGWWVHDLVTRLRAPGAAMEDAGDRFADALELISAEVEAIPLVGTALASPFQGAAGAGRILERAGIAQQEVVGQLALVLAVLLAGIPILWVLSSYLPGRLRWIREAGAARRLRSDPDALRLLALRAAVHRPLPKLLRAVPDPGGALASGDYEPLARLELKALGLRT